MLLMVERALLDYHRLQYNEEKAGDFKLRTL